MIELTIESITKPLKENSLSKIAGKFRGQSITIDLNSLFVNYDRQRIDLDSIPGTYGGIRYFFLCPDCGRRCRKLYKQYLYFSCGTCQQIHKQTLNRSKTDCQYYWECALREARKVEPGWTPKRGGYMFDDFPSRPRRMRRTRYWRHYKRFMKYWDKGNSLWLK